ncbi:MAG: acyl carrier protein [Lacipirellulaceae bacterium]
MWLFKLSAQMLADFKSTRSPQEDEEFVRECNLPAGRKSSVVAIGVREAIAELGQVEPTYVRANDRFDNELVSLPFWDSLDTIEVILTLEKSIGIPITESEAQRIRHPESVRGMTVSDFVTDVYEALAEKIVTVQ